jgi:hypothetical protein
MLMGWTVTSFLVTHLASIKERDLGVGRLSEIRVEGEERTEALKDRHT